MSVKVDESHPDYKKFIDELSQLQKWASEEDDKIGHPDPIGFCDNPERVKLNKQYTKAVMDLKKKYIHIFFEE